MLGRCTLVAVTVFGFALGLIFLPDAEEFDSMELDLGIFADEVIRVEHVYITYHSDLAFPFTKISPHGCTAHFIIHNGRIHAVYQRIMAPNLPPKTALLAKHRIALVLIKVLLSIHAWAVCLFHVLTDLKKNAH